MGRDAITAVGPLPMDWQVERLKALTTQIGSGATPRGGAAIYLNERVNYAIVRSQNVFDRFFNEDGLAYISDADAASLRSVELQEGDILLNITGDGITFARSCLVPRRVLPACVNQHVVRIRCDRSKCIPGYLVSFLTHPLAKEYIESFNAGGSRRAITKGHIESFEIPLPAIAEQQAIACILGALDDKIELNRRRNRTLEAMARAIFQSWFVDFDPVRAKVAGRAPAGLSPELAALFPDSFEDSALGPIPKGWRVQPLPEVFEVNPKRILAKGTAAPYLDMANMPTQGPSPESWVMREMGSGMKFINGDTLVARITPCLENGKTAFVDFLRDGQVGWGSTEYIVLRPSPPIPPIFAYLLARMPDFRMFAIRQMTGSSGRQRVPADSLGKYCLAIPENDSPLFTQFGKIVSPMFSQISATVQQSRTLAALRDALLPELISGALRVADAQRIVGRMT